jgi:uncharacterized repeat protein (TIGR03803 family)
MMAITAVSPLAHGQALTVLYSFGLGADGDEPGGGLVRDAAGNLYGTTYYGGSNACQDGCGTIFKLDANGEYSVLYRFGGSPDGENPDAGLIRDSAGNLYGTTNIGGAFRGGTVFKLDTTGKETVLHSFAGEPDGSYPVASLVRDAKGNLYGTTLFGGDATCDSPLGCGTVFRVDTSGHETVLHAFAGGADGELPAAPLVRDSAGNLYGTTDSGGAYGVGVVFKLDSTSKETVLYSFAGGTSDGSNPFGGLVTVGNKVYGTTGYGGAYGFGTVYEIDETTGKERLVYSFMGGADGKLPSTGLVRDKADNLYGATEEGGGGGTGNGTVFKVDATGTETVLHHFAGGPAGADPSRVILDEAGNLYGTCGIGGNNFFGTIFEIEP